MSDNSATETNYQPKNKSVWSRGLYMLIFLVLFGVAETVLFVLTIVQFFWMVFGKETNQAIADFGVSTGNWLAAVARFQTGVTDDKPFPWGKWE